MTHQERLSGANGCKLISDTGAHASEKFYALIVQEDTVIGTLSGADEAGTTVNYVSTIGLSGKTLKQGCLILCPLGDKITSITLTSGSVMIYNL